MQRNSTDNNGKIMIIVCICRAFSGVFHARCDISRCHQPFFKLMTLQIPGVSTSDVLNMHLFKQADTQIQTSPCICNSYPSSILSS